MELENYGIRELRAWMAEARVSGPRTTKSEAIASIQAAGKLPPDGWRPSGVKTASGYVRAERAEGHGDSGAPEVREPSGEKPEGEAARAAAEEALRDAMEAVRRMQAGASGGGGGGGQYVTHPELEQALDPIQKAMAAASSMADTASSLVASALEKAEQARALAEKAAAAAVTTVELKRPDEPPKPMGTQHRQFPELLLILSAGVNAALIGPAGSGKTHAAEAAAEALGKRFYCQSFGQQTPLSQLVGYMDANGNYVRTVFRDAFEHGGVYLLDEMDRANPNVLNGLNAALANGYCSFPDGMIKRSPEFLCIAAMNTYGGGASRQYVGATQQDAALLDRFPAKVDWDYDEALEAALSGNVEWARRVQAVRKAVDALKIRRIIGPRMTFGGARLLAAGMKQRRVEEITIWAGMDEAERQRVEAKVKEGAR